MSSQRICWLHHCHHRSKKQVRIDHKFITLKRRELDARLVWTSDQHGDTCCMPYLKTETAASLKGTLQNPEA